MDTNQKDIFSESILYNNDLEIIRNERKTVLIKFNELKNSNKLNLFNIKELINHCNTIQIIIEFYLNMLKDLEEKDYVSELINYYKILSPEICKKYGIFKMNEKEIFYNILSQFQKMTYEEFQDFVEVEFSNVSKEVKSIYENEIKNIKDSKKLDEIKKLFIRWDNIYNSSIDFTDIYNEEYFYYKMSNSLLRDFEEGLISYKRRKTVIENFIDFFKNIEPRKKEFPKYFEFICLTLLNGELEEKEENTELKLIIDCIEDECKNEYFDLENIKKCLNELNIPFNINNNNINIKIKNFTCVIDNYKNYNINKDIIKALLIERKTTYKNYLKSKLSFNSYINEEIYFNGILNEIILNYSKSQLSKDSIEKLFNINKNDYKKLFDEVTTEKIMKYIYYIPYNSNFDTERTLKLFSKIIIDPIKNLYKDSISNKFLNSSLGPIIKKFVNIVLRKYKFEHEQQHLVTILLFYIYVNSERRINSLAKEIDENNNIGIVSEDDNEKNVKKKKNIIKEAGYLFEEFCYGKRQKEFSLKQLLYIANEDNYKLDCYTFKKNYEKCENEKSLDELLKEFPKNQPLTKLVNDIKDGFEEEKILKLNYGKNAEDILGNSIVSKIEDNKEFISFEEFENMGITKVDKAFNNHLYIREFYKH